MSRGTTAFEVPCHESADVLRGIFWRSILAGSGDQCPATAMTVTVEDEDSPFSKNHSHGVGCLGEDGCLLSDGRRLLHYLASDGEDLLLAMRSVPEAQVTIGRNLQINFRQRQGIVDAQ